MSQGSARGRWFAAPAGRGPLVLIATERVLPEADPDEAMFLEALEAAGLEPRLANWDGPGVDWSAARLAVIRSTWNYFQQRQAFVEWAERTARETRLWNPPEVVAWNAHKAYLLELARAGVPVAPTELLPAGQGARLTDVMSVRGWPRAVVKPAVSASSYRTLPVEGGNLDEGEAHLAELLADADVLVQPYVPSVEHYGERAVIWIDGKFTHAVRKSPRFAEDEESVSDALPIAGDELEVARAALSQVREPLLYARVDLARDPDGHPMVMELELIESSLYLLQSPSAMERLVNAIQARVSPL